MKKILSVFILLFFITGAAISQNSFSERQLRKIYPKSLSLQAGAVISSETNALKFNAGVHNLFFKYAGFYTSFEVGVKSDYFSNIIGLNVSFLKMVYAFAGADFFTKNNGVIHEGFDCRKEIGLGIFPVKNLVVQGGFSWSVGATVMVGYRIPFKKSRKR
jgi:hypothetical protein